MPETYYDDTQKMGDFRQGQMKIFYKDSSDIIWHGIGAPAKEVDFNLKIMIRTADREQALRIRDTLITILDSVRTRPTPNYDWLTYSEGDKTNNFVGNYRWEFRLILKQNRRMVGGI